MTGTVQRELLLQRGWDLGLVVLKEEGGFPCSGTFWRKHCKAVLELRSFLGFRFCQALCPGGFEGLGLEGTHLRQEESCYSKNSPSSKFMG